MTAQVEGDAGSVTSTMRISVLGARGRLDLAAPVGVTVGDVAGQYVATLGGPLPTLSSASGASLAADLALDEAGLRDGGVLVVEEQDAPEAPGEDQDAHRRNVRGQRLPGVGSVALLGVAVGCAAGASTLMALAGPTGVARLVGIGLLALCALACCIPFSTRSAETARLLSSAGPGFGAAAGFTAAYSDGAGGLVLAVAVAALVASAVAAVARSVLDEEHDELVDVWLVIGGLMAALAVVVLLAGARLDLLFAVLFAVALLGARMLPSVVIDVPDQALLDLDRLAVTAWTAREQPRGSRRRRSMVRAEGVGVLVRRGQLLVASGTVATTLVAATAGPLLVLRADRDFAGWCALAMVGLGGIGLALTGRSYRAPVPRLALRLTALWLVGFLGVTLVRDETALRLPVFAALAVGGLVGVGIALLLGRGWRSVWWARAADVTEGLSVASSIALIVVVSGLFDAIRVFMP